MNSTDRYRLLTTGRGGDFRNLVLSLTNDPRDFPSKSELKAQLEEIYPGEQYVEAREAILGKLVQVAKAREAGGIDLLELRGICDEYVLKVEKELADDDRLIPVKDTEPEDVSGALEYLDNVNPGEKAMRQMNQSLKAGEIEAAKRLADS